MTTKDRKLTVISPYFNPLMWKSRKRLFDEFKDYCTFSGVDLLVVEVGYRKQPFEVTEPGNPMHLQLRSNDLMWHKERAVNLGIQHLLWTQPDTKVVAWIDGDVRFSDPEWAQHAIDALDHYDVIQLFSQNVNLGPQNEIINAGGSVFYNWVNGILPDNNRPGTYRLPPYVAMGHPGLAWAATIQSLNKLGGLIDYCIHGSGDSHMANALMGNVHAYYDEKQPSQALWDRLELWQSRATEHVHGNIGYITGICFHYWHGNMGHRQYGTRWGAICDHKFNPDTDIYAEANGLYRWTGNKKELEMLLTKMLRSRNEDSVDLIDNNPK